MLTVITMTSWTGRIKYMGEAIFRFMTTQTVKPDVFYLWLAEEEFPDKEADLPTNLLHICRYFHVMIKWIKDNEYCHKRWYVYPSHYNDLVISIDDDVFYDTKLIEQAQSMASKYRSLIINCGDYLYPILSYDNSIQRVFLPPMPDIPSKTIQLCGQCIVLPHSFPLESISTDAIALRKHYCKKCDECWLTPYIVNSDTRIMTHKWNNTIINGTQDNATWKSIIRTKHIQLYLALRCNDNNLIRWKHTFPKFNDKNYEAKSKDELLQLL